MRNGVKKTVESMLISPIRNLGVQGITHLANQIVGWALHAFEDFTKEM
ncbi:MAG: hypothetical protein ACE5OY_02700 [Candidatus Bathyarchaeia archaeon]